MISFLPGIIQKKEAGSKKPKNRSQKQDARRRKNETG
jgi:hypothetical protein